MYPPVQQGPARMPPDRDLVENFATLPHVIPRKLSAGMPVILVVDDEPDALELVEFNFRKEGWDVHTAASGTEALRSVAAHTPDLVVLDLTLPVIDGLEVCRRLRHDPATTGIPIIMLTAKAAELDRVVGLELGADDYITKPFSPRELVLRVQALLRRSQPADALSTSKVLVAGTLRLDPAKHEVSVGDQRLDLTITEFRLLHSLMESEGRVLTRNQLLRDVWGYENAMDTRTVDTHMRRLREKLGTQADLIATVRGVGYRFSQPTGGYGL